MSQDPQSEYMEDLGSQLGSVRPQSPGFETAMKVCKIQQDGKRWRCHPLHLVDEKTGWMF